MPLSIETPAGKVERGDTVYIRKGALVRSMAPGQEPRVLTRRQKVVIKIICPYGDNPTVSWAGTSGYWQDTHPDNVEAIDNG